MKLFLGSHCVTITGWGYDAASDFDYWIIRNSWYVFYYFLWQMLCFFLQFISLLTFYCFLFFLFRPARVSHLVQRDITGVCALYNSWASFNLIRTHGKRPLLIIVYLFLNSCIKLEAWWRLVRSWRWGLDRMPRRFQDLQVDQSRSDCQTRQQYGRATTVSQLYCCWW